MRRTRGDKLFFSIVVTLIVIGIFVYASASLGLITRKGDAIDINSFKQFIIGLGGGSLLYYITSRLAYRSWKTIALPIFIVTLILTAIVFIPHVGVSLNGATRWLSVGPTTIQPSEFLKFGFIIYCAAWLSSAKNKLSSFTTGLLPFAGFLGAVAALILAQPDTGTFMIFLATGLALFLAAGGKWTHLGLLIITATLALGVYAFAKPHVMDRIETFFNPNSDPQGQSFHARQALLAIGSGKIFGKGFGQSIQKFNFLPEPTSDSIFAVAAEEFGFIGSLAIVILFSLFSLRGYHIALRTHDPFGRLLVVGFVTLIASQSFVNIAAMLGLIPLTGVPLLFISHGGTAYAMALAEVGIIMNVSKARKSLV